MREKLSRVVCLLSKHYAVTHATVRRARQAANRIDELRSALDNEACRQFPDGEATRLYYPGAGA